MELYVYFMNIKLSVNFPKNTVLILLLPFQVYKIENVDQVNYLGHLVFYMLLSDLLIAICILWQLLKFKIIIVIPI